VSSGSITLAQVAERTAVLVIACNRCERAGRYPMATLIARHEYDFTVPELLLRRLSDDCTKRASISIYNLCGVHCPELSEWFLAHPVDPAV
jgi:hypothetical protein